MGGSLVFIISSLLSTYMLCSQLLSMWARALADLNAGVAVWPSLEPAAWWLVRAGGGGVHRLQSRTGRWLEHTRHTGHTTTSLSKVTRCIQPLLYFHCSLQPASTQFERGSSWVRSWAVVTVRLRDSESVTMRDS